MGGTSAIGQSFVTLTAWHRIGQARVIFIRLTHDSRAFTIAVLALHKHAANKRLARMTAIL